MPLIHWWAGSPHIPHTHKSLPVADPEITTELCCAWWLYGTQRSKRAEYKHKEDETHLLQDITLTLRLHVAAIKGPLCLFVFWKRYSYYTHSPSRVSRGKQYWLSHKSNKRGLNWVTPTLRYQSRNMTQQHLAVFRQRERERNILKIIFYSPEVSHCFQSAANTLPVLTNWNQTKRLHRP